METLTETEELQSERNKAFKKMHSLPVAMVDTRDKSLLLVDREEEIRSHWARSENLQREFSSAGILACYWRELRAGRVRISGQSNR